MLWWILAALVAFYVVDGFLEAGEVMRRCDDARMRGEDGE